MTEPALLLDEDVRLLLADILRQRGYDAVHVLEAGRGGCSDLEQLNYAIEQGRAVLTHNVHDFLALDQILRAEVREHFGIMLSDQVALRELLRRTLQCLNRYTAAEIHNQIVWLHSFK